MGYFDITIAGIERRLPICRVNDKLDIAAFVMFSDVEITIACARELLKLAPEFDLLITAEAKGIPLAYEMARQSGKPYYVARKATKVYMRDPLSVTVTSITTLAQQTLYLDRNEAEKINSKKVLIVDDVISTGESLAAVEKLVKSSGGIVVGKAAVLAEGDAAKRNDLIYLEPLPLFFK